MSTSASAAAKQLAPAGPEDARLQRLVDLRPTATLAFDDGSTLTACYDLLMITCPVLGDALAATDGGDGSGCTGAQARVALPGDRREDWQLLLPHLYHLHAPVTWGTVEPLVGLCVKYDVEAVRRPLDDFLSAVVKELNNHPPSAAGGAAKSLWRWLELAARCRLGNAVALCCERITNERLRVPDGFDLGLAAHPLAAKADGSAGQRQQQQGGPHAARDAGRAPGGRLDPVLAHLLRGARSGRVRKHFFANAASEYTEAKDVRVLAGTYNVAGRRPPPGATLHEWLGLWKDAWPQVAGGAPGPDVVAVGFQEVVPLNAGNALLGPSAEGADAWDAALAATLNGDEWAVRNIGRTYGSSMAEGFNNIERLGSQARGRRRMLRQRPPAAYAYSVISNQAASAVMTAMDKMWVGQEGGGSGGGGGGGAAAGLEAAAEQQQQARLQAALASGDPEEVFVQVASKQMVGLYLSVWARKRVARHVRGVQTASAATGWGGYVGNKGAVAARFRVHDAPFCVVCAHLASGDAEGDELRRNADAADILRRCAFPTDAQTAALGLTGVGPSGHWGDLSAITDHGNVVWLGDLNYRLPLPDEEARRLIAAGDLERLLRADQLAREMEAGRVFVGWREGPITFDPTYKYHLGCSAYSGEPLPPGLRPADSAASFADGGGGGGGGSGGGGGQGDGGGGEAAAVEKQKRRTPAWCDRILWLQGPTLHQLAYGRGELTVSDHRPVAAAFLLQAHRYERAAVESLLEAARRHADASEMADRPKCAVEPRMLDAGVVAFGAPVTLTVSLSNEGAATAAFYFVAPPRPAAGGGQGGAAWDDDDAPLCPPWLRLAPEEGTVEPGDTRELQLTVQITGGPPSEALLAAPPAGALPPKRGGGGAAPPLPPGAEGALDAVLILRVEDGGDAFVCVSGSFVRSAFGRDLDALARLGPAPAAPPGALSGAARALRAGALDAGAAAAAAGAGGDGAAAAAVAAGGAADNSAAAAAAAADAEPWSPSGLVPKEILRLTGFLRARLSTPGLFVHSHEAACGLPPRGRQARGAQQAARLAAATLLALFQQLPDSFMPPPVSALLARAVPGYRAASALLSDSLSAVEWAAARHVLALLREALAPPAAARNGLTVQALAEALAEYWFVGGGGGGPLAPPELAANRIAFLMTLLDPGDDASSGGAAPPAAAPPAGGLAGAPAPRGATSAVAPAAAAAGPPEESLI
ncbi:MAG: hypothetical protein J3K34DRAFT_516160 [Monoraphidium minutum]|nr:MAG: hypothetical protein J3K34DRAFT_516160 [Monoraphidium minutum]